jgi:ABC-type branched-subunit amino acid transport system ATPase component
MSVCDRVVVLDFGRHIAEGSPAEVQADRGVLDAYLGVEVDAAR